MSFLPRQKLAADNPELRERRQEARTAVQVVRALLAAPVFAHNIDLSVLGKIAASDEYPLRERRHAAEALLMARCKLVDALLRASGARELALADMGISDAAPDTPPQINIMIGLPKIVDFEAEQRRREAGSAIDAAPERAPAEPQRLLEGPRDDTGT